VGDLPHGEKVEKRSTFDREVEKKKANQTGKRKKKRGDSKHFGNSKMDQAFRAVGGKRFKEKGKKSRRRQGEKTTGNVIGKAD